MGVGRTTAVQTQLAAAAGVLALAFASPGRAQIGDGPPDPHLSLKQLQAMRFPQPVRVGDLNGRAVIQPGDHMTKLGVVVGVFRPDRGGLKLVFRYGGVFGLDARTIAPDLVNFDLVGPLVKVVDLDPKTLKTLPTFTAAAGAFLGPNQIIRLGVDRKY